MKINEFTLFRYPMTQNCFYFDVEWSNYANSVLKIDIWTQNDGDMTKTFHREK